MARISTDTLVRALRSNQNIHVTNLSRYFTDDFSGSHFERFADGGDAAKVRNLIAAEDLLAVTCLSVNFPAHAMLNLIEGEVGEKVADQLSRIPVGEDLHNFASNPIAEGSPAWNAWALVDGLDDVGRTLTSKLLARKRPQLLPVLDDVVTCALRLGNDKNWQSIYELVTEESGEVVEELNVIRDLAAEEESTIRELSTLRVLDVVVWMEHRPDHYPPKKHKNSLIFT
jgi:hypothetical protein